MKPEFEKITDGIYRLCVPFDGNIYTSVFALIDEKGTIIVDSGSNEFDATNYVIPALENMQIKPDWFICTHLHGDHHGGLKTLIEKYPNADVGGFFTVQFGNEKGTQTFEDEQELFDRFKMFHLKGHSNDGLAVLDKKTATLVTGDCLQQLGLTRFGTSICGLAQYRSAVNRVREIKPKTVVASHDYEPFGYLIQGEEAIEKMLLNCIEAIDNIELFVIKNENLASDLLAKAHSEQFPKLPYVPPNTFQAIINSRR